MMIKTKVVTIVVSILSGLGFLHAQDLELDVYVIPTSVLGDPILFNVTVKNKGNEPVQNVKVQVSFESGAEFSSISPKSADYDSTTGVWNVGEVNPIKGQVLGIIAKYAAKDSAIVMAEIISSSGPDPDSTPDNGIDTNGNGILVNDNGDEDDGDAAQNGPFR